MNEIETEPLVLSSSHKFPYGSIDLNEETDCEEELQTSLSRGWKSLCRIEVAAFLQFLYLGLHSVPRLHLMVAKVCTVDLNLGDHCNALDKHPKEELMVQESVSDLYLYSHMLANIPK